MQINHPFKTIYDNNSKVLILGSFPSVKSREQDFYYAHPAILDVLKQCEITGLSEV